MLAPSPKPILGVGMPGELEPALYNSSIKQDLAKKAKSKLLKAGTGLTIIKAKQCCGLSSISSRI
ncbi:hypothetical protein CVT24_009825 [Panaeolus cyanescens]|uniref:Uncharacterized protein n=1 Tax=Panaeolus cyanescens TaxID=181874 RepID=A0A409X7M0_9AGAR|nr:hypothetical protein CVT24_009825 [Panaeolus cyanescens]